MKKILLFSALLFHLAIGFGQDICKEKLQNVIDGLNNFKDCSQAKEIDRLIREDLQYVVNTCSSEFLAFNVARKSDLANAWKKFYSIGITMDCSPQLGGKPFAGAKPELISKLNDISGINTAATNQTNQSNQSSRTSAQPEIYTGISQLPTAMRNINNVMVDKASDNRIQNIELAKLEIEPEFNNITSPDDFKKVSLTTISYTNLLKLGIISTSRLGGSIFADIDKVKDRILLASKIEASFMGANTIFVKVLDIGRKTKGMSTFALVDLFGIAFTNKEISFNTVDTLIKRNKIYKTVSCYKLEVNDTEFDKENCNKTVLIQDVVKNNNQIEVTAKIDGVKETSFRLINCTNSSFVLMYKDEGRKNTKIYNYKIGLME